MGKTLYLQKIIYDFFWFWNISSVKHAYSTGQHVLLNIDQNIQNIWKNSKDQAKLNMIRKEFCLQLEKNLWCFSFSYLATLFLHTR